MSCRGRPFAKLIIAINSNLDLLNNDKQKTSRHLQYKKLIVLFELSRVFNLYF